MKQELKNDFKELTYKGAFKLYGTPLSTEVKDRIDKELNIIIKNGGVNLYRIAQKLVEKSSQDGYIVGNLGAIGSSIVAYCLGITEIDPIKYNIPFETFAGFNRK